MKPTDASKPMGYVVNSLRCLYTKQPKAGILVSLWYIQGDTKKTVITKNNFQNSI